MALLSSTTVVVSERIQLAKFCASRDWSKAIRVLDSLLSDSCIIQDICNRAFCYSQLELHKHVIKDCDEALKLDPTHLQAYILKGRAISALGRKEDALLVWEQGHAYAVCQSTDFQQLLELEDLLMVSKQNKNLMTENHVIESSGTTILVSEVEAHAHNKSSEAHTNHNEMSDGSNPWTWSSSKSEICDNSGDSSDISSDSSDKIKGDEPCQSNGIYSKLSNLTQLGDDSKSFNESSDSIESCSKLPIKCKESLKKYVISSKSSKISDILNGPSDETKRNRDFCVARISKNKSISIDFRLSRGIAQVNEGKYAHAISIFDQILREDPTYPEALIGRGTAYAFKRELEPAINDFTKALLANPSAGEAWKRRGQAQAALGEPIEAIKDLTRALDFEPNSTDILHERGIVNFKFKNFHAAVEDLSACLKLDNDNKSAYTYLGLALSYIGEYKRAEQAHMKAIQLDQNFVEGWTHLTQFYHDLANPPKMLECIQEILQIDNRFAKAYYMRGLLSHGMGEHRKAIKDFSHALSIENSNIDCLYLRASCHHAIGEYGPAVKDYDAALDLELDTVEKFVLQCLAFYQKEIALYTASKMNSEFCWFDIDGDVDPLFKEYWCKRLHPKSVCEKVYRQPPLRQSLKKGKLRKQDFVMTKQRTALLLAADSVGNKIQYSCPGFLPNKRQHRMAGLAAIEIAQKVSKAWRSMQVEWKNSNKNMTKHGKKLRRKEKLNILSQNRGGVGCSTSSFLETPSSSSIMEERSSSRSMMSWRDVYSLSVKWRQISEPCDPVVWINKLSEEFNSGFGSNTPIIIGQAKVVRYFQNCQRALDIAKVVMKEKMFVHNKADDIISLSKTDQLKDIMHANSCSDLHKAVGEDFWLATWCNSTAVQGKQLEGTRITLLKMGEHGYDFAIRTPCTPSRWEEFDAEMTMAWDTLCNVYCGETYGSTDFDVLESVREAILRMTYYWYNFMPLSRGSAAVGFVVMLGLFLAANMEFTGSIPQGLQVDWEAILNLDPKSFVDSVKSWLYPSLDVSTAWKNYPDVASTFSTTGSVVAALSSYED